MYDIASALIECSFSAGFETLRHVLLEGYREYRLLTARDEAVGF